VLIKCVKESKQCQEFLCCTLRTNCNGQCGSYVALFWFVKMALVHVVFIFEPNQCYLMTNLYVFYEVANSYKFIRPHSYDFVRFG